MVKKTTTIPMLLDIILNRIERLDRYTRDLSFEDYSENEIIRDACERNIEVIGEIAKDLFKKANGTQLSVLNKYKRQLLITYETKNRLTHGYDDINNKIMFSIYKNDLTEFKKLIINLKESLQ